MILIVDDRPVNIFALKSILERHQFEVDTAESGEEALKKVLNNSYSLIILDVQMPDMDGFEVAEMILGHSKSKDTPIIFLSAISKEKQFITKGYKSGGMDYITKPVDPDILLLKVKSMYELSEQKAELKRIQQSLLREIETRKQAEAELAASNELLEQRVEERTLELLKKNRELELSNSELQQFAWVISHDLKEPIRKIMTFTDMVSNKYFTDNEAAKNDFNRIIKASERMSTLIRDLLDFSRISIPSRFEETPLDMIVNEVIYDVENQIEQTGAIITKTDLPTIEAVPSQMRQVFQNLISNSLKFTNPGVVPVISISCDFTDEADINAPASEQGKYCRVIFTDNGIGFDEQYLDKIFMVFQRLSHNNAYEGTGIGLAIAKKSIEKHNGIITARSQPEKGTTFVILLPVKQEQLKQEIA